jgi:hypothetical protein
MGYGLTHRSRLSGLFSSLTPLRWWTLSSCERYSPESNALGIGRLGNAGGGWRGRRSGRIQHAPEYGSFALSAPLGRERERPRDLSLSSAISR